MPVTENSKITIEDYNRIRTLVVNLLGPGSASQGYGQNVNSVSKSTNEVISQSDWDRLRFDLINVRVHQIGAAFTVSTNFSNSLDKRTLRFSSASSTFLVKGMAVFGSGTGHPIATTKFITDIQISNDNTIITLNAETESVVPIGTAINFGPGSVSDFNEGTLLGASSINAYETLSNTSFDQRFLVANGQFVTDIGSSISRTWSSQTSPRFWSNEISCELAVTFNNSNNARYFFNSGGEIRVLSQRTGGRSDSQNNAWSSLLTGAGLRSFGGQIPILGFTPMDGQNFFRLTSTYQPFYSITSSAPYAANIYRLEARCNVANNSSGTASIVYLKVRFIGGYTDPGSSPADNPATSDEIDGTFSVTVTEKRASGKLLPSGNFTISRPSYSISTLTGA